APAPQDTVTADVERRFFSADTSILRGIRDRLGRRVRARVRLLRRISPAPWPRHPRHRPGRLADQQRQRPAVRLHPHDLRRRHLRVLGRGDRGVDPADLARYPVMYISQIVALGAAVAIFVIVPVFWATASYRAGEVSPEITQMLWDLGWYMFLFA